MAVRTQRVAAFEDDSIVLTFDWDDATGDVELVRCVNTSTRFDVHVLIQGTGTGRAGRSRDATFAADSGTTEISIPPGQQPRYPVVGDDPDEPGEVWVEGYNVNAETIPV